MCIRDRIKGNVKDKEGNPLPYASVYLIGSSTGTVSNASGDYELELKEKGQVTITCQYVGYKKETFTINYTGSPVIKNIILSEDENLLNELVIIADREDPSYPIIRKAIKKRDYYKNLLKSYEADLYVKGCLLYTSWGSINNVYSDEIFEEVQFFGFDRSGVFPMPILIFHLKLVII